MQGLPSKNKMLAALARVEVPILSEEEKEIFIPLVSLQSVHDIPLAITAGGASLWHIAAARILHNLPANRYLLHDLRFLLQLQGCKFPNFPSRHAHNWQFRVCMNCGFWWPDPCAISPVEEFCHWCYGVGAERQYAPDVAALNALLGELHIPERALIGQEFLNHAKRMAMPGDSNPPQTI